MHVQGDECGRMCTAVKCHHNQEHERFHHQQKIPHASISFLPPPLLALHPPPKTSKRGFSSVPLDSFVPLRV